VAITTADGAGTAQAMGRALDEVVSKVADGVAATLRASAAAAPTRRPHSK
jgi:hypothetical protein